MNESRPTQDNMTSSPFEPNMKEIIENTLNNLGYKKDKDTMSFKVLKAYENREYHNTDHLKNMFTNLRAFIESTRLKIQNPNIFNFAIIMHDFVNGEPYDVEKSANCAENILNKKSDAKPDELKFLKKLIMATNHKNNLESATLEEKLIADLDLGIFASSPDDYDNYAAAIRKEYKNYNDKTFAIGRKAVLEGFLNKKSIYHTDFFKKNFETLAKINISAELAKLIK